MKPKAYSKNNPKPKRLLGDATYSDFLDKVKCNEISLNKIPHEYLTEELCLSALFHSGHYLTFIPKEKMTPAICMAAMEEWGSMLKNVPKKFKTRELCR